VIERSPTKPNHKSVHRYVHLCCYLGFVCSSGLGVSTEAEGLGLQLLGESE
jgi:hypothetical protein